MECIWTLVKHIIQLKLEVLFRKRKLDNLENHTVLLFHFVLETQYELQKTTKTNCEWFTTVWMRFNFKNHYGTSSLTFPIKTHIIRFHYFSMQVAGKVRMNKIIHIEGTANCPRENLNTVSYIYWHEDNSINPAPVNLLHWCKSLKILHVYFFNIWLMILK